MHVVTSRLNRQDYMGQKAAETHPDNFCKHMLFRKSMTVLYAVANGALSVGPKLLSGT